MSTDMFGSTSGNQTPRLTKQETSPTSGGDLIEIVNVLQNKLAASGHTLDISLPQIIVVGSQSAGKSSVLEAIVGREFLPRGSGVVTRRPTIVQLEKADDEYAVFLHKREHKFTDFKQVRDEIENQTLLDPGPDGFTSVPISMKIYSPNALKLTLVDLPGLIRVTVENQSEDSIEAIRNMVLHYIEQPNSLILAVSPANQDLASSDALEIAKIVDPGRARTIGVITKLDLMDEGTNAATILENKVIPLKRGYVGVINRSQKDIDDGKDFEYSLEKEKRILRSKPYYKHLLDRMGTSYLKTFLHQQLYEHIKQCLPGVRNQLIKKLTAFQKYLKKCEAYFGHKSTDSSSIQFYMFHIVQKFIDKLQVEIFGYSEQVRTDTLSAGVIINYKLFTSMQKNLRLPDIPDEDELMRIISNMQGFRCGMSFPSLALEKVTTMLMSRYIDPLNEMVDSIADTLLSSVEHSALQIKSYPKLHSEILYYTSRYMNDAVFNTKESLEKHMQAEMYFVNTYHHDFSFPELQQEESFFPIKLWDDGDDKSSNAGGSSTSKSSLDSFENTPVDGENGGKDTIAKNEAIGALAESRSAKINARYLAATIERYLTIQKKHIGDIAIKYISYFLVKKVMDFVKNELTPTLLNSTEKEAMFKDCEKDINKINEIKANCEFVEEALNAIQMF